MKHRYSYDTDSDGGSAAARLVRLVGSHKEVLELGTGPGSVTQLLHRQGCKVTGVEMESESIEICRQFCSYIIQADLELDTWKLELQGKKFDVIVIADVLEHLREPHRLLKSLEIFLRPDGYLVLSLPNVSHLTVVASLMAGRFPYQRNGLLDQTHLRFFGREDIDALLRESGFLWSRWEAARLEPIHGELKGYWSRLDESGQRFLANNVIDGDVYQHVIAAFPSNEAGHVSSAKLELAVIQSKLEENKRDSLLLMTRFEQEVGTLQAQLVDIEEALKSARKHSGSLEDVRDQLQLEQADLRTQLKATQLECQSLSQENSKIEELIESMQQLASVDEVRLHEINALKSERQSILTSRSWRLTAPLRFVFELFIKG